MTETGVSVIFYPFFTSDLYILYFQKVRNIRNLYYLCQIALVFAFW